MICLTRKNSEMKPHMHKLTNSFLAEFVVPPFLSSSKAALTGYTAHMCRLLSGSERLIKLQGGRLRRLGGPQSLTPAVMDEAYARMCGCHPSTSIRLKSYLTFIHKSVETSLFDKPYSS
jgi:hypothetical protein